MSSNTLDLLRSKQFWIFPLLGWSVWVLMLVLRDLIYQMEAMDFSEVPEVALEALSSAFDSDDSREARKAFLEKREPVWRGN